MQVSQKRHQNKNPIILWKFGKNENPDGWTGIKSYATCSPPPPNFSHRSIKQQGQRKAWHIPSPKDLTL
jgi:hypothetical protein